MKRQSGFGLIEIMIALALGLVLSLGIINVYLDSRRNYQFDEEAARMQESARYAIHMIKRELSMAGFIGGVLDREDLATGTLNSGGTDCASTDWALNVDGVLDVINDYDASYETIRSTTLTCLEDVYDDTDIVIIKRSAGDLTLKDGVEVNDQSDNQWYIKMTDRSDYEWAYVADGDSIPDEVASGADGNGIDYWEYQTNILYVRDHSFDDADGIPTLCMESLVNNDMDTNCYVEGVESFQVEVGVDSDNDGVPERFEVPASTTDMDTATAMRVYVLMRSINTVPFYTNSKTYSLGQKDIAAKNDGYLRQVFSTTIEMRNLKVPI